MRYETSISLPAKPSLTQTTLGQLCVAPQTSRSRPVKTEPGPRVSDGTAGAAVPLTTAPPGRPMTINLNGYSRGTVVSSKTVKDLGVTLDPDLSFEEHIKTVSRTAFFPST